MRIFVSVFCLLVTLVASSQYSGPGFYRVHSAFTDTYISIKGTKYNPVTRPDAFWPCILMVKDSAQCSDPGSIIYIKGMEQTSLCSQGVSTYSLTGRYLDVATANVMEDDKPTYTAMAHYNSIDWYFRDTGVGLTVGTNFTARQSHWWIEPVNEESIDTSFLGVKPTSEDIKDAKGWYWTSIVCDYPIALPKLGGVEGAYTIKEIVKGEDGLHYATAVKVYGQGDTVPAATPVLLKCQEAYASGNKVIPVEGIANHRTMPIVNDLLMGNYFSNFINYASFTDPNVKAEYIPAQATKASADYLALGIDEDGKLGFFPQAEDTYMAANTAWLCITDLGLDGVKAVYLIEEIEEPQQPEVKMGDVNGDGTLTVSDASLLINYLLNTLDEEGAKGDSEDEELPVINTTAADLNNDDVLNITDLTLLLNILLNTV